LALFVIADLHLSLSVSKPMDIFKGWENYERRIEKNWNELVTDEDTVIIAGDISWTMKLEDLCKDFLFINNLKGQKIILKGNHDYWWSTRKKMEDFLKENCFDTIKILHNNSYEVDNINICGSRGWFYDEKGDSKVLLREVGRIKASLDSVKNKENETVLFLHYPPIYNTYECKEITELITSSEIKRCYYGHIHGEGAKWAVNGTKNGTEYHLAACDFTGFSPVRVD